MRLFKFFSIFFILSALGYYLVADTAPYQTISGATMGTYYNIKIKTSQKNNALSNQIKDELQEINKQMSVFDNSSEISRINASPAGEWIALSPQMSALMKNARHVYKISKGAFDPTVGRLVDLWGFGKSRPQAVPTDAEIKETLKSTGFDKIKFSSDFKKLQKQYKETYIDLSAIAKGYGVDRISKLLEAEGYRDYVVEIGGEVVARGQKSEEVDGWNVGIVKPGNEGDEMPYVIRLKNAAVATSGDYRNFHYDGDKRYSHTISPQTGYPVEYNLASVTVFRDNCMEADALATAIMSMGAKEGLKFADKKGFQVIMFVRGPDDKMQTLVSKSAKKLLGAQHVGS